MKSLREAAQAVCDRWDTPSWKDVEPTAVFIGELREAIAREEAQIVEPAAYLKFWAYQQVSHVGDVHSDDGLEAAKAGDIGMDGVAAFPMFTRPAPAKQPLSAEREALIAKLEIVVDRMKHGDAGIDSIRLVADAMDMLAADAQRDDFNDAFSNGRQPWRKDAQQVAAPQGSTTWHGVKVCHQEDGSTFTEPTSITFPAPQPPQGEP